MCTRVLPARPIACAVFALSFSFQPAVALDPSATALAIIQSVSASGPGGARVLEPQRPVYSGDRINTGPIGQAQIRFRDDTRLVVAANSSLVIDKYVFDPNRSTAQITMNATKGAFRFISGRSGGQAYSIRTPSATIGVRGTQFDIAVARGATALLVFQGAVRMCGRSGRCVTVSDACGAAVTTPDGGVRRIGSVAERTARIRAQFPLVVSQASLRSDFRASTGACSDAGGSPTPDSTEAREASLTPAPAPEPEPAPSKTGKGGKHGKGDHHDGKDGHHGGRGGHHDGKDSHDGDRDGHDGGKGGHAGKGDHDGGKGNSHSGRGDRGDGGKGDHDGGRDGHSSSSYGGDGHGGGRGDSHSDGGHGDSHGGGDRD